MLKDALKPVSDVEGLVGPLLGILDELRGAQAPPKGGGPSMSDTLNAKLLAEALRALPKDCTSRNEPLSEFLRTNPKIIPWASKMFETREGRMNLKALLRLELNL